MTDLILACNDICLESASLLNLLLYEYTDKAIKKLAHSIQHWNRFNISIQIEELNDIGFFLIG